MAIPAPDFLEILRALSTHKVDFIVVGGVCAAIQGAPVTTFDLDIVHSRSPENLIRLIAALRGLGAYYRGRGEQRLLPQLSHLSSPGHQLLMTQFGPLDVLGTIGSGRGYEELVSHSVEIEVGGICLRALDLRTLIDVKRETISEKDKAVIPILMRTLEEKTRQ